MKQQQHQKSEPMDEEETEYSNNSRALNGGHDESSRDSVLERFQTNRATNGIITGGFRPESAPTVLAMSPEASLSESPQTTMNSHRNSYDLMENSRG
jgi:hypothetical protein